MPKCYIDVAYKKYAIRSNMEINMGYKVMKVVMAVALTVSAVTGIAVATSQSSYACGTMARYCN
ncbi:hypothetical protein SAMN04487769_2274 [Burkholderia sp. b14]|nr:hypothetical protein SAMN04487769_2274 [Burkholderia sp. b14]